MGGQLAPWLLVPSQKEQIGASIGETPEVLGVGASFLAQGRALQEKLLACKVYKLVS